MQTKRFVAAATLVIVFAVAAFADALQGLGVTRADATRALMDAVTTGHGWSSPARAAFVKASPAARVALVEQLFGWAKTFVMSPEFEKLYAAAREEAKPAAPDERGSIDAELKRRDAEHAATIAEMRKAIASLPAQMQKDAEKTVNEAEAEWKRQKSDPEFMASLREMVAAERGEEQQRHTEELQRWKEDYPANGRQLVAKRLRDFLGASDGVAYDAKLVRAGNRMQFADADYEAKPSDWKLCYRAGREPVERARALAKAWLAELP